MKPEKAFELVLEKLGEHKRYRSETVLQCPFCKSDKHKFYVNMTTFQYNCKLGSCNEKGNLTTLIKHLGLDIHIDYDDKKYSTPKKNAAKLNVDTAKFEELTEGMDIVDYMAGRGVSLDTLVESGCKYNKRHDALVIANYVDKSLVSVIYRKANKSIFMEAGSKQFLWGTDYLNKKNDTIYITEGHV